MARKLTRPRPMNADRRPAQLPEEARDERLRAELCALFSRRRRPKTRASVPTNLSHYQLLKNIGAGARGIVYLARDRRFDQLVAIKVLRSYLDRESRQRFLREAECASAMTHPNIVTVHKVVRNQGLDFIVMEYVAGRTLDRVISKRGLPLKTCLDYALQMAAALAAIHSAKMIHRDLKPANFLIGETGIVILLDFGLAKVVGRARRRQSANKQILETLDGTILGTPGYMSPEQVRGQAADPRSDVFSFGTTFYEMLTGRPAFREDTAIETMSAILRKAPPKLPARIPARIAAILRRCLAKEPSGRYKTAKELEAALTRAAQSLLGRKKFSGGSSFQN
jgi:serine/threonine protein kinase